MNEQQKTPAIVAVRWFVNKFGPFVAATVGEISVQYLARRFEAVNDAVKEGQRLLGEITTELNERTQQWNELTARIDEQTAFIKRQDQVITTLVEQRRALTADVNALHEAQAAMSTVDPVSAMTQLTGTFAKLTVDTDAEPSASEPDGPVEMTFVDDETADALDRSAVVVRP